jgi:hypothetical protein
MCVAASLYDVAKVFFLQRDLQRGTSKHASLKASADEKYKRQSKVPKPVRLPVPPKKTAA